MWMPDVKGVKVFSEKAAESGTYKIKFSTPGEYRISFYNSDVVLAHSEN